MTYRPAAGFTAGKNTKKFELKKIKGVKTLKIRIMSQ